MLLILSSLLSTSPSPPLPLIECDVPRVDNFPPYYCFVPLAWGELGLRHTIDHTQRVYCTQQSSDCTYSQHTIENHRQSLQSRPYSYHRNSRLPNTLVCLLVTLFDRIHKWKEVPPHQVQIRSFLDLERTHTSSSTKYASYVCNITGGTQDTKKFLQ